MKTPGLFGGGAGATAPNEKTESADVINDLKTAVINYIIEDKNSELLKFLGKDNKTDPREAAEKLLQKPIDQKNESTGITRAKAWYKIIVNLNKKLNAWELINQVCKIFISNPTTSKQLKSKLASAIQKDSYLSNPEIAQNKGYFESTDNAIIRLANEKALKIISSATELTDVKNPQQGF